VEFAVRGRSLLAVAALAASALGCSRAPLPEDPGQRPYHDAVVLFAKLSDDTQDLTYRDPRFDDVIDLCGQVPPTSELRPKADALAGRIRQARTEAEAHAREAAQLRAQAEASPDFQPEPRVALPATAQPTVPPGSANSAGANAAPGAGSVGSYEASSQAGARRYDAAHPAPLPEWYRKKGYFGGSPEAAAVPAADSVGAPAAPADVAPAPPTPAPPVRTQAAPVQPVGPPPVFGLPGPAGHALAPPPPQ
jgi:hypothetical protein